MLAGGRGRYTKVLQYHDPELAAHLAAIDLRPELYAIPWSAGPRPLTKHPGRPQGTSGHPKIPRRPQGIPKPKTAGHLTFRDDPFSGRGCLFHKYQIFSAWNKL